MEGTFHCRNKSCGSSALTIPSVERSVAMQLCPTAATTLRGDPCLPSWACKYSSSLTGSVYRACGEAASALHAMALLQVHQAKDLHEGGHDLAVLHENRQVQTWRSVWRQAFSANEFLKSGVRHFHVQQGPTGLLHMSKCHLTPSGRSQFRRSSDMTSPFPPSGNEGYIRNRDVLLQIYILEHVFSWFIVEL